MVVSICNTIHFLRLLIMCRPAKALVCSLLVLAALHACRAADDAESAQAIRHASRQYLDALARGDAEAAAAFWTPMGDLIDSQGRSSKGRELARKIQPLRSRDAVTGPTLEIDSLRFVHPDVAMEDGTTQWLAGPNGESALVRFSAVWVRSNGNWLLDSVRESALHPNSHAARLQALSWLVGDWVSSGDGPAIEMTCRWTLERNFLLREIRTQSPDEPLSISQRIGWDPASGQIKSWTFDSHGGHGTGVWSQNEGRWVVDATGVLPDGRQATSRNLYALEGRDSLSWESVESTIAGAPGPQGPTHKVRLVRKQQESK